MIRRLRRTAESLTEALRKKSKDIAAHDAELETRRAEIERLRRKLEGIF